MILIFDLDDTLYDEINFVISGFRAVAHFGQNAFGWDAQESELFMSTHLQREGRGTVFDAWLRQHDHYSKSLVATCVRIYRNHRPKISLHPIAVELMENYQKKYPLYLVTDGHKMAQKNKIAALGIKPLFKRTFITHNFGIQHAKPSLHCFEIIKKIERCAWSDMVYIGDNPAKDFVSLNAAGAHTIRVSTGPHASTPALPGYDAQSTVQDLYALPATLKRWYSI